MDAEEKPPALQIIVLGCGGGPLENNTTAFLVRPVRSGWRRGSLVGVDAGVHLGAIAAILENTQPPDLGSPALPLPHRLASGPFAGLELPFASARANAGYVVRDLVESYLVTHPHLDHISGFVINTAAPPSSRLKRLAGLPGTIEAFKKHIFNNVIWPNLSDENNGAGLVTYLRLVEGGSFAFGDGDGKGYLEISDGLSVKAFGVSHGHCMEKHSHRGSVVGINSRMSVDTGSAASTASAASVAPPPSGGTLHHPPPSSRSRRSAQAGNHHHHHHQQFPFPQHHTFPDMTGAAAACSSAAHDPNRICVVDSSAYFIRDVATGREVLIFGDVEPDSVSLTPRNFVVWSEAAPRIARGDLVAVVIECSYDNGQAVDQLYGHLTPRHVVEELCELGRAVELARGVGAGVSKKRKREPETSAPGPNGGAGAGGSSTRRKTMTRSVTAAATLTTGKAGGAAGIAGTGGAKRGSVAEEPVSPKTKKPHVPAAAAEDDHGSPGQPSPMLSGPTAKLSLRDNGNGPVPPTPGFTKFDVPPLKGLKVVIIHVKDKLWDGPDVGETILQQLMQEETDVQTGAEFVLSHVGQSLYL